MTANINTDIRAEIEQELATAFSGTPIAWQNVPFTPPNSLWLRPFVTYGAEDPTGYRRDVIVGALVVEVFAPTAQGAATVLNAIETVKTTFYRQWVGKIRFPSIMAVRQLEETEAYLGYAIDMSFIAHSDF